MGAISQPILSYLDFKIVEKILKSAKISFTIDSTHDLATFRGLKSAEFE